ncbi:uncharacterized protein LOC128674286 isoform X2 [Plodia interpunctella]|uniref:uncharacterized protein LOC128674286 isoform X2 n=1 Tax=Plodia interpunctella TaxID=58824 RepID=UPI002368B3C0|nr:uncharacterized protein LOC128674286 isoform X2 [Plodia interpunctella]
MEKLYKDTKEVLIGFRLDYCCWFAPIGVGIYIIGWLNIIADIVSMLGTMNDSVAPIILKVQETMLEDLESKLMPLIAYSTEMCFTVVLLCGMYRKDTVLLTMHIYYTIATMITEFLLYSIVFVKLDVLIIIGIIFSFVLQLYTILLVRSYIVKIKARTETNGRVHYSAADQSIREIITKVDVETPPPTPLPSPEKSGDQGEFTPQKDNHERLETVKEDPKESTSEKEDAKEFTNV